MKYTAIIAALLITACSSHAEDLERQFEIAKDAGDLHSACRIANDTAQAFLEAENAAKYERWKQRAVWYCYQAVYG